MASRSWLAAEGEELLVKRKYVMHPSLDHWYSKSTEKGVGGRSCQSSRSTENTAVFTD